MRLYSSGESKYPERLISVFSTTYCYECLFSVMNVVKSPTSLRCMFRLGHSPLNINMKCFRQCSCGYTETLEHLLLQYNLPLHHRNLLLLTLKNTLLNEKSYNQPQYSTITYKTLIHTLLFATRNYHINQQYSHLHTGPDPGGGVMRLDYQILLKSPPLNLLAGSAPVFTALSRFPKKSRRFKSLIYQC